MMYINLSVIYELGGYSHTVKMYRKKHYIKTESKY